MDAKENARRIIRFDSPQRIVAGVPSAWIAYRGANHEGYDGGGDNCPVGSRWTDVWGTGWQKEQEGVMGFPRVLPIRTPADLRTYRWPNPDDERLVAAVYAGAKNADTSACFLCGSHRDALWEKSYMLAGMETVMDWFFTEPAAARDLLHGIMDFHLGMAKHYLAVGVEIVRLTDDLGTQSGPLLGPRIVSEFLVPEYRRLFELYKSRGVMIHFHSCGRIDSVIDTFLDLGVDVLNPVQATANDLDALRARTAGRMALEGAVSSALVLAGPPERIAAEARRRMWQLGRDGGYFCCPDQGLPFPPGHVEALRDAVEQFGRYPLQPPDDS